MKNDKTWLVTGASKGLGLELVTKLLQSGYKVAATSRSVEKFANLQAEYKDSFLPLSVEITSEDSVNKAIDNTVNKFGSVDVLVNNAGFGLLGTLEELSAAEIKNCFDVNVFGVINFSRAVLPFFRQQKSGVILNVASVSGSVAAPSTGFYSATKSAVIQISEALAEEVREFGIKVVAICPGGFRTDFLDKSSMATPKNEMPEYSLVRNTLESLSHLNGRQGGDPKKAADAFIRLAEMPNPPSRIYLGSDALRMMERKINNVVGQIQANQELSLSTDSFTE